MLSSGKKFCKHLSIIVTTVVIMIAVLTVPSTLVQNALAEMETAIEQEDKASESLHEAVRAGDLVKAEKLISQGAEINEFEDNQTPLHIAVSNNNKDITELLLEQGANIDSQDGKGRTPLHLAVGDQRQRGRNVNKDIAELLLAKGADVNIKNHRGQTPLDIVANQEILELFAKSVTISSLRMAVQLGDSEKVKAFLEQGTDINSKDDSGDTALHIALARDNNDITKLLIEKGANVNAKGKYDHTPLYYAISNGNKEMISLMVSKGADVNVIPEEDCPPLHYAVWEEVFDIVKILVDNGAKCDVKDVDGLTALNYAIFQGRMDMVELFMSKGVDKSSIHMAACAGDLSKVQEFINQGIEVDTKDEIQWTALIWAVSAGQTEVAEYLINNNADVNITYGRTTGHRNQSLLHQAAESGALNLIELLLSKGMDVNVSDERVSTPISRAAWAGHLQVVEILVSKGANINGQNLNNTSLLLNSMSRFQYNLLLLNNRSPLYMAVARGHCDVVKFLINKGADTNVSYSRGRTLLDIARRSGHTEMVDLLRQHGIKETLFSAVSSGDIDEVKRKISLGANLEARDGRDGISGKTALIRAAENGRKDIVELLLENGADIEARDGRWGSTALLNAAVSGRKEVVESLLEKGANIEAKNSDGLTPLHLTAGYGSTIHTDVIQLLIDKGADIETRGHVDTTPLQTSVAVGRKEVAELLLAHGAKLNVMSRYFGTPAHHAMKDNHRDVVRWAISKGIDIPPMHQAAYFGETNEVRSLLGKGADVNLKDIAKFTPLHCAIYGRNEEIVQFLIGKGADVNARDCAYGTPLFWACARSYLDMVKLLVDNGAGVNDCCFSKHKRGSEILDNWSNLHMACIQGHLDVVEYLLDNGADIHAKCTRGDSGLTPLHLAAKKENVDVIKILLANGADVDAKTEKGETPLSLVLANAMKIPVNGRAQANNRFQVVRFLRDYRSLIRKRLPELKDFGINLSPTDIKEKIILVCFFDIEQRPSRHFINQLAERAEQLKQQNIIAVAVQASEIEQEKFDSWIQENNLSFSAGILPGNMEEKLNNWSVKAMPWLILTDTEHVVTAEGFSINELDSKIKTSKEK